MTGLIAGSGIPTARWASSRSMACARVVLPPLPAAPASPLGAPPEPTTFLRLASRRWPSGLGAGSAPCRNAASAASSSAVVTARARSTSCALPASTGRACSISSAQSSRLFEAPPATPRKKCALELLSISVIRPSTTPISGAGFLRLSIACRTSGRIQAGTLAVSETNPSRVPLCLVPVFSSPRSFLSAARAPHAWNPEAPFSARSASCDRKPTAFREGT